MKGVLSHVATFLAGALVCGVLVVAVLHSESAGLKRDLDAKELARAALAESNVILSIDLGSTSDALVRANLAGSKAQSGLRDSQRAFADLQGQYERILQSLGLAGSDISGLDEGLAGDLELARRLQTSVHSTAALAAALPSR
jgi:hypothetical protein